MSDHRDGDAVPPGHAGDAAAATSYAAYAAARARFLEHLRVDAEVRRLESLWRRPAADVDRRRDDAAARPGGRSPDGGSAA